MDVAARPGVADAPQHEAALRVGLDGLRRGLGHGAQVGLAEVARQRLERPVERVVGQRAVIADHLVDEARLAIVAVGIGEHRLELVAVALERDEPRIGPHLDAQLVELVHMGAQVGLGHLAAEHAVGRDDLDPGALRRHELGAGQRGVVAALVDHQHRAGALDLAGQHVPRGDRQLTALEMADVGQTAGGDDDDVGVLGDDVVGLGQPVEPDVDAEPRDFRPEPVRDADQLAAPGRLGGEHDLAAELGPGLEQHDLVAARRRDPRGLEPARPAADDDHLAAHAGRRFDDMRQAFLAAGRDILDAQRVLAPADPVDAIAGADASADLGLAALAQLVDEMRVGDQRARHADHVEVAVGDGMRGGRGVGDARRVEDRQVDGRLDAAGERQIGRRRQPHGRPDTRHRLGVRRIGADHADEVDQAAGGVASGDLDAVVAVEPTLEHLVARHANADDVIVADRGAHRLEHLEAEAQPVVERAAIAVAARVHRRRPELLDQRARLA